LIDAPVLFESGFDKMCHATVCVLCPQEEKIDRIVKRDGITREQAQARIASQLSDEELKNRCTYAIDNSSGSLIDGQIISILKDLGLEKN
jgi:dephospho-CoA kinase